MGKTKLQKFERIKRLPNVTFTKFGEPPMPDRYPWRQAPHADLDKLLELGCGKGEHSLAFAADQRLFCIGVDIKSDRLCVGAEMAQAVGRANVHFLRGPVERLTEFFPAHSIAEIWLTFPDPHLKRRDSKKRLTSPLFLEIYAQLLVPGGTVHLKTDCGALLDCSRTTIVQCGGEVVSTSQDIHGPGSVIPQARCAVSAFEHEARARGKTIKYLAFTPGR